MSQQVHNARLHIDPTNWHCAPRSLQKFTLPHEAVTLLPSRLVSGTMDRVGDTMHMHAAELVDAIVGECCIYLRPHNCAIIGCGIIDGVLCFNLGYNLCTPSVKGCADTIKRPCIEREKKYQCY